MTQRVTQAGLQIGKPLYDLVEDALPGTGVTTEVFWGTLARLVEEFTVRNQGLLGTRERLQDQIDDWHRSHRNEEFDFDRYKEFLYNIGYLQPIGDDFKVTTANVDPEISTVAGPQLVVPVNIARFSINAANARWGSLYNAFYGTDVIPETDGAEKTKQFNPKRGAKVVEKAAEFLDATFSLTSGTHADASAYRVVDGQLEIEQTTGRIAKLSNTKQFSGYVGDANAPSAVLLVNNGLHAEIQIDKNDPIGKEHAAGVKDVLMESAVSTIQDCEDSIAAVDAQDKAAVYRNWLGLMKGDISAEVSRGDKSFTRTLNPDRDYTAPDGSSFSLPGRSMLLVRNVGHLMTTPAVLDSDGNEIFEGILDALVTSTIALHDLKGNGKYQNSRAGSVYIVKPKMHGPGEVQFTVDLFAAIERSIGMEANTLKIGIMDEERRTTLNLKYCIHCARERIIFINTGFLDRTGDEINTSMEAGPMLPKGEMKSQPWLIGYEQRNVDVGLLTGLRGHAQIGKGMWAQPDSMAAMLEQKINHPLAGANTAWVPSPTAATLHAIHYHQVNVIERQKELEHRKDDNVDNILTIPLLDRELSADEIQSELDNNCQGILGYVVRWVGQGVGASKVPNIHNEALMEDRATCRISSQHIANWVHHGIATEQQVEETLKRMAKVVDEQNAGDSNYTPMAPNFDDSLEFQAARELVIEGRKQPKGYTEPVLHAYRRKLKAKQKA